jgi:hypothetical protein
LLDPSVTLAQRRRDAELEIKIAELTKDAESCKFCVLYYNNYLSHTSVR